MTRTTCARRSFGQPRHDNADCLAAAQVILLEAVDRIPASAALHYKLAAIEAQLGEVETAKARLKHAISLAPSLRLTAVQDKDLEPLWNSLGK